MNRKKLAFVLVGVFASCALAGYWYVSQPIAGPQILALAVEVPVKVRKPVVKLKVQLTDCLKFKVTIPLTAAYTTQADDIRIAKGYVENIGELPVQFVQVQVRWKDRQSRVIDHSDLFAVTDESLAPGEKAHFQSTKRNTLIEKCGSKVLDWWVVDESKVISKRREY